MNQSDSWKKDDIPAKKKEREKKNWKEKKNTNKCDFKLTRKKCFTLENSKKTQNKTYHKSQWSTRVNGHLLQVATHLCADHHAGSQTTRQHCCKLQKQEYTVQTASQRTGDGAITWTIMCQEDIQIPLDTQGQCVNVLIFAFYSMMFLVSLQWKQAETAGGSSKRNVNHALYTYAVSKGSCK